MTRKLVAAAAALAMATLAACASGGDVSPTDGPDGDSTDLAGTSISYWVWKDDPESTVYEELAEKFQEETGIEVQLSTETAYADFYTSIVNAVAAGNAPDAAALNTTMLGQMSEAGVLEELTSYIDGWEAKDEVTEGLWSFVQTSDGSQTYAMPFKYLMFLMLVRQDLLDAAGVEIPATQEEFVQAVEAITAHGGGHYGFNIRGANGVDQWAAFVVAGGARFVDDSGAVVFDSPEARKANELYISTFPNNAPGAISQNSGSALVQELEAGTTAMIINHIGGGRLVQDQTNIVAAPMPSLSGDPANTSYMGTMNMNGVLASSEKKAAAFEWISYLAEADAQLAVATSTEGYVPVVTSVTEEPALADDQYIKVSLEQVQQPTVAWPNLPGVAKATSQTWAPLFQGALLGDNAADDLITGMADSLAGQ